MKLSLNKKRPTRQGTRGGQKSKTTIGLVNAQSVRNKGAVAGFLPTTESNLRTAMGVEICKLLYYRLHLQTACKDVVLGICRDQKRDMKALQI